MSFGDSSWNMRLRAWIDNAKRHPQVRSAINMAIVRKFRANNVEIPFPQRDLHVRSPLPVPLVSMNNGNAGQSEAG
jgi:small-conductance mechanosensitive channel